jgi:hypothetical protein
MQYNLSVPSGKTSRGLVLHRADKSGVKKVTYNATTCAVSRTDDGTAWYPINSTANSTYCSVYSHLSWGHPMTRQAAQSPPDPLEEWPLHKDG